VEKIRDYLESRGVKCWIAPRDIPPGSDWAESIMKALARANTMIMVLTSSSNQSAQVRREVEHAVNAGVSIIPVVVDGTEPSVALRYYISAHQWVDASNGLDEAFLKRLADSLLDEQADGEAGPAPENAVVCSNCGFSNPAGAKHCAECGARIGAVPEKPPQKGRLIVRAVSVIVALLLLAFVVRLVVVGTGKKKLYSAAVTALQEERWQDAYRAFDRLGLFGDSKARAYEALLGGIESLHRRISGLEAERPGGADREWEQLSGLCTTFLQEYPDSTEAPGVRMHLADALFALEDYAEAGDMYLSLAEEGGDAHRSLIAAARCCESFLAAYGAGELSDTSAALQRQLQAVNALVRLQPPPGQLMPFVVRVAENHFQAGMLQTSANLWRRIFMQSPSEPVRMEAASMLSECYLLLGDTTEAERWKLLATGELPARPPEEPHQGADSLPAAEDSLSAEEPPAPHPQTPPETGPRPQPDRPGAQGGRGGERPGSPPGRG
jgi:hypothetical protein